MAIKRAQIIEEAKQSVLYWGPCNVLEFGWERITESHDYSQWPEADQKALYAEMIKQAVRAYRLFGYNPPFTPSI